MFYSNGVLLEGALVSGMDGVRIFATLRGSETVSHLQVICANLPRETEMWISVVLWYRET